MNELVPTESSNVVIGVCGEQGSGKTVFLTCVFQSIWTAFPDDVILDFDRDEIGNADYFQEMEELLIKTGNAAGTGSHQVVPARIYVKPYEPLPTGIPPVLSVDIQDFAGGHFQSLANLKRLGAPRSSDPEHVKALRTVNETVKAADAFVILINAKAIDPLNDTPTRNPFSPSVNFLLAHCREKGKPVALLFSQSDQTPLLDDEAFQSMPRVKAFERQFTADHAEAAAGKRPFGIVRRIACYHTVEGDLAPIRQTLDGSIWRPEPAQVVLELLRAAMPRINARLADAAAAALRQQQQAALEAEKARRIRRVVTIAAAVALLLTMATIPFVQRARAETRKIELLASVAAVMSSGRLGSLPSSTEVKLGEILTAYRNDRGGTSSEVREGIRDVHRAFALAAQRLASEPAFDSGYKDELLRFRGLAPILDPENTAEWRPTLLPLLEARTSFLSEWFARTKGPQEGAAVLESAIRHFTAVDSVFARVLALPPNQNRRARVSSSWNRRRPGARGEAATANAA